MWTSKLKNVSVLKDPTELPNYAFQYFFRNIAGFKSEFYLLSLVGVISAILRFSGVLILGSIISKISSLTVQEIFYFYLPIWIVAIVVSEFLDFFLRRYGEALPLVFADYTNLRFYLTYTNLHSHNILNFSKERLLNLSSKYSGNLHLFLADWIWGTTFKITRLIIILTILFIQSPLVLMINVVYMLCFLTIALKISRRFSAIAKKYSEQNLETLSLLYNFVLGLNTMKRLRMQSFFLEKSTESIQSNWKELHNVRTFHAYRWLLQLNLFNLLYLLTIAYGIYQVKEGLLPLGFLILIKWAFDELWFILVYIIEYYVSLVQQKQDSTIVRDELALLWGHQKSRESLTVPANWAKIELKNIYVTVQSDTQGSAREILKVPSFKIKRGEKIGVIGASGSGKTTLLNCLLNLINYEGQYLLDDKEINNFNLPTQFITIINSSDQLFKLSLYDNILLGRKSEPEEIKKIIQGTLIDGLDTRMNLKVGSNEFNLSSGQEQRVRIARGLFQNSQVFLLDEPLNGLDEFNKENIINFLKTFLADKTVILVTHNEEELRLVDKIFEIKNGVFGIIN